MSRWKRIRNQVCCDCHFYVKDTRQLAGSKILVSLISDKEREQTRNGDFSWQKDTWTPSCHMGVWDEGHDFDFNKKREILTRTNRRGYCFYWPYRKGMLLPAARVLQEREAGYRQAAKDRRLALVGLWIAALALLANVGLTIAENRGWWPF